jgi:hypothetical protein
MEASRRAGVAVTCASCGRRAHVTPPPVFDTPSGESHGAKSRPAALAGLQVPVLLTRSVRGSLSKSKFVLEEEDGHGEASTAGARWSA